MNLDPDLIDSLTAKLESAQQSLAKDNLKAASNKLGAFMNHVEALRHSRQLSAALADMLISEIQTVIYLFG